MCDLSVEATRWRHVQVAGVSGVSVPDAAGPLPPQQLGFSISKSLLCFRPAVCCCGPVTAVLLMFCCVKNVRQPQSPAVDPGGFFCCLASGPDSEHMHVVALATVQS